MRRRLRGPCRARRNHHHLCLCDIIRHRHSAARQCGRTGRRWASWPKRSAYRGNQQRRTDEMAGFHRLGQRGLVETAVERYKSIVGRRLRVRSSHAADGSHHRLRCPRPDASLRRPETRPPQLERPRRRPHQRPASVQACIRPPKPNCASSIWSGNGRFWLFPCPRRRRRSRSSRLRVKQWFQNTNRRRSCNCIRPSCRSSSRTGGCP